MLYVANVLVEFWVNCHMFGADGEPLTVLASFFDIKNEWDACWVFGHHFFDKTHRKVHSFDNQ
jgi:hypothetical protein